MDFEGRPVKDAIAEYFNATDMLLIEIKRQGAVIGSESVVSLQLQKIIRYLSNPSIYADNIRLAFIQLSSRLESELIRLHEQGLYPDLYCGGTSKFQFMEYIIQLHRNLLYTQDDSVPEIALMGSQYKWRDKGVIDFVIDQQNYLKTVKFEHLWDAVQAYEIQRYLLAELFVCLDQTGNL